MDIQKLKREKAVKVEEMRSILDAVDSREDKAFADGEEARYDSLEAEANKLDAVIEREEKLAAMEARSAVEAPAVIVNRTPDAEGTDGFRSFSEWFTEVRTNPSSSRLQERAITQGNNDQIGYVVPEKFSSVLRQVLPSEAIVKPRCQHIPTSEQHPDAPVHLVALDQSGTKGVNSGVTVQWVGETDERQSAGDPTVKRITLTPNEASAYIDVSNRLLNNSELAAEMVQNLLRQAIISAEEIAFLSGDGTGKPTGYIGHASNVTVARSTAATVTYDDIVNMDAMALGGILGGEGYIWIGSRSVKPTLRKMNDTAGNLIWQTCARAGEPDMLLGYPIYFSERVPGLGTTGDLMLVNLQAYAVVDGSPLAIFIDPYSVRKNGQTRIYAGFNVDGKPLLTSPVQGEDGVGRSAFVKLSTLTA